MSLTAYAQDPYYISINRSTGLPSNDIYCIIQDSKGFIWIANEEGLTRFDGYEYKTYAHPNQSSKAGSIIKEDKYGRIWYQNFDGFIYYVVGDSMKTINNQAPLGYMQYGILGNILITIQQAGINIYDLKTLRLKRTMPIDISDLGGSFQAQERYYITKTNICYLDSNEVMHNTEYSVRNGFSYEHNGQIYLVDRDNTSNRVSILKNGRWEPTLKTDGLRFIQNMSFTKDYYWFCTPKGVAISGKNYQQLNNGKPFFEDYNVSCVFQDNEKNYWIGTLNQGILFVPDINMRFITKDDIKPMKLASYKHKLLIATKYNEIYEYQPTFNKIVLRFKDSIRHNVNSLKVDTINNRIILTSKGLKILDTNYQIVQSTNTAIKDAVVIDNKYYAYAATGASGLMPLGSNAPNPWDSLVAKYQYAPNYDGLSHLIDGRCKNVSYNPFNKTIYSGSSKGLYRFTYEGVYPIKTGNQVIYTQTLTQKGIETYALTTQNTVIRIGTNNIPAIVPFKDNSSVAYKIKSINNELYAITNNGLQKYNAKENCFVTTQSFRGIRNEEINDIDIVNNILFVATEKGLLLAGQQHSESQPSFRINRLIVNGIVINASNNNFSHNNNNIEIQYSIFSYKTGGRYPLYYRINEGSWQLCANTTHTLKLASLAPGDYTIYFRLGEAREKLPFKTINFCIKKPYWQQLWFWTVCLLTASGIVIIYYRWRVRQIQKENSFVTEKMELESNLRTSMLTAIRSQMNPHFFYNALNTIQSFIFSDDKRNASTYLVKFSKLTRTILEMSEKELVSLNEETEALTLYLELEKMRFNDDFNFAISTLQPLETERPLIPPMIVQPYVENAVKHGLLHKKGAKTLTVEFRKLGNNLCITIDDNGIGRQRSEELKKIRNDKHISFSTKANNKRIELLNKDRNNTIAVNFIDKKDEAGDAAGTTVVISIPLI